MVICCLCVYVLEVIYQIYLVAISEGWPYSVYNWVLSTTDLELKGQTCTMVVLHSFLVHVNIIVVRP